MEKQYKYDVAFSFLADDEELVLQLNDLIKDRLNTFVYSERQKELAGTDGMESFSKVFAEESRIVVIFLRENWGKTTWTGIEETAIRGRAYEEQFDFTIFVPLDTPPKVPAWLPKNRLWYSLERYGLESLAAAIESKVQEQGGKLTEKTAVDYAARLVRDIQVDKDRTEFLKSGAGFQAALAEVELLGQELERLYQVFESDAGLKLVAFYKSPYKLSVSSYKGSVTIEWVITCGNMVDDAVLHLEAWDGFISHDLGRRTFYHEPNCVRKYEFGFTYEIISDKTYGWRMNSGGKRFFSSKELSEYSMKLLLDVIRATSLKQ